MRWLPDLVLLDIETTGGAHLHDRITEVALIKIEGGEILTVWESLINPGMPIPRHITGLTGISDDMVKDASSFKDIAGELYSHLEGQVMVAHNVRFDYGFLKAEYNAWVAHSGYAPYALSNCLVSFIRIYKGTP